jgi:hypothetical protein
MKQRPRVGHVLQPIGGQSDDAVDAEFDRSPGLRGQARQSARDAGHGHSTKSGSPIVAEFLDFDLHS